MRLSSELNPKLQEKVNIVNARILELEDMLQKSKGQREERHIRTLIDANKQFLIHLDVDQENFRLEN